MKAKQYEIRIRQINEDGSLLPWEKTTVTEVTANDLKNPWNVGGICHLCQTISKATGREVRYNNIGSMQGHYIGTTVRPNNIPVATLFLVKD